jgi:hypothetical protein
MPRWRRVGDEHWFVLSAEEADALRRVQGIREFIGSLTFDERHQLAPERRGGSRIFCLSPVS